MPLEHAAPGTPGFSRNVEAEVAAGKPVAQAVAIAYANSGERSDAQVKGPDGKMYPSGTKFHRIGGKIHPISPANNINIRGQRGGVDSMDAALTAADALYARSDAMARGDWNGVADANPLDVMRSKINELKRRMGSGSPAAQKEWRAEIQRLEARIKEVGQAYNLKEAR